MSTFSASLPASLGRLRLGALSATFLIASLVLVHADTPANKLVLYPANTNAVSAAVPATPASASGDAHPSTIITDSDDDDNGSDTTKVHDHGALITIEGHHGHTNANVEDSLIPLAGILGVFGMPVLIVFFVVFFRYRRRRENLAMAREYLNKGMPVPAQLLDDSHRGDYTDSVGPVAVGCNDRRRGIKLLAIGLGVSLALYFEDPRSHDWAWGLILVIMGLGYLLSGWIDGRQGTKTSTIPPPTGTSGQL